MIRKAFKEIWQDYTKLPFIVYRKQYLLPQRPFPPIVSNLINKNGNMQSMFQKDLPQLVDKEFKARIQDPTQSSSLQKLYRTQMKKKHEKYKVQYQNYRKKYLQVLQNSRIHPHVMFYYENKERILKQIKGRQLRFSFLVMHQMYRSLPEATKQKYIQQAQQKRKQKIQSMKQMQAEFKIPEMKKVRPFSIYSIQNGLKVTASTFNALDQQIKIFYIKKAQALNEEKETKFLKFIKDRGLTLDQFNEIKRISVEMEKLKKQLKKEVQEEKELLKGQKQEDEITPQDEEQIQEIQQQPKSIKSEAKPVTSEVMPKERQQNERKDPQEEKKEENKTASVGTNENNVDFEEEEVDVFELKKMAEKRKQTKQKN